MPNFQNPVADTSLEVLRIPVPVIVSDLAGNTFTLNNGGIPVSPAGAFSLSSANTGLPVNNPAIVQKTSAVSTGSVASLAKAFASNNVAGNSIVVVAGCGNGTAMTVADSAGNTYTSAVAAPNSTTFAAQIFFAVGIIGGANTVTVTNAGTTASMAVEIYEVSGLITQAQAQPGQSSTGTGTGTTATTSRVSPSVPNALAFAGVAIGTGVVTAVAAGSGLTYDSGTLQPATPSGLYQFASFSGYLGNIGGISPSVTWTTSEPWAMAVAIFKSVAVGIEGTVALAGYSYTNITTQTTTLVKTGPGILHGIIINTHAAGATIEMDDALTHTTPKIGTITLPGTTTSAIPISLEYDIMFSTGLSITTGVANADITVVWK
jgi:hypothetical protein